MAFYDKHKGKKPSGGRSQKHADERNRDEHTARRAHGPAEHRHDTEYGRPRWMDEDSASERGGSDREGYGRPPQGGRDFGRPPQGGRDYGRPPQGGRDFGRPPQSGRDYGRPPQGGRGFGGRPQGGRPPQGGRSYGGPPQGDRPYGGRPQGDRPFGGSHQEDRGYGSRDFGNRPPRSFRPQEEPEEETQGYSLDELEAMIRRVVREELERHFTKED